MKLSDLQEVRNLADELGAIEKLREASDIRMTVNFTSFTTIKIKKEDAIPLIEGRRTAIIERLIELDVDVDNV